MLVVPQIVPDIVGTIINVMVENMREARLVCQNIFLNILVVKGIMGSYMTFQLLWSIKLMKKILLNDNTPRDLPSKRWHLMVLMLKMVSKSIYLYLCSTGTMNWPFTYYYFNFGYCNCNIVIVVVVVSAVILPYNE